MYAERHVVTVTTIADGSATAYSPVITGRIVSIRYVKPAQGGFDNGVGFTITAEATGETIWAEAAVNASATRAPRQATHSTAGVAALFAAGGTAVGDAIVLAQDRVKIVVAAGGNVLTGTFHILVA
jgi:hypothetical protein